VSYFQNSVIPAQAGIQIIFSLLRRPSVLGVEMTVARGLKFYDGGRRTWTPAFAGVTLTRA
jgi:hypothetical protein